jgi:hypothetical protein
MNLTEMFSRAATLPSCDQVKTIWVDNGEVPAWLHLLAEWENALPVLSLIKRQKASGIIAGVANFQDHRVPYFFFVNGTASGRLQATGIVMLAASDHEECAESVLRTMIYKARENAGRAGVNFLSMEKTND